MTNVLSVSPKVYPKEEGGKKILARDFGPGSGGDEVRRQLTSITRTRNVAPDHVMTRSISGSQH